MEASKLNKAAVGRFARLGDLYDARRDEFIGINSFKAKLGEEDIYEDEANSVDVNFIVTDELNEKLDKLGIDADLSLSILSGLIKLQGSATYLHDQKSSTKARRMTLTYSVYTVHQEVDGIRSKVDKHLIENCDATHVVVGIDWGAKCNITCEYKNSENEDDTTIKGKLKAEIENLKGIVSLDGSASVDIASNGKRKDKNFSYHSKCDVSDMSDKIPSSFEAAINAATKLPTIVKKTNDGKGIPLSYNMMSINTLKKMLKIESGTNLVYRQIEEDVGKKCLHVLEDVSNTRQKLHDLITKIEDNESGIQSSYIQKARNLQNNFDIAETSFKGKLLKVIVDVRSGKCEISSITNTLENFRQDAYSPVHIEGKLAAFDDIYGKIELLDDLKIKGVLYLGRKTTFELALEQNANKKVYMLYMNYTFKKLKPENWQQHIKLFFSLWRAYKEDNNYKFIVADTELNPDWPTKQKNYIECYEKGILCCEDVFAEEAMDLGINVIKSKDVTYLKQKPNKRVPLDIRCPLSFKKHCSPEDVPWVCKHCKDFIEYGIDDDYFYCKCGGAPSSEAQFRCSDPKHGLLYEKYENKVLRQILSELRLYKETNVLILGETGVGKSTWINAMANYLAHSTLNDATQSESDIKVLIPTQFSYTDENGRAMDIRVGDTSSSNEVLKAGQSATQDPKAYKFFVGSHLIQLIDTPGIGDVRGLEQDEINFENILAHLSYYNEIHGICILLKPNDSRLTVTFRFCVTELLTHLDKSAAENIIFCFTNARSTFYRPGDTLPVLKSLISEYKEANLCISPTNQFCFDNEAFRFLACLKNNVVFDKRDIETYSSSWDRAVHETERLFQHISKLRPHNVEKTVNLNNARRIILELSKPLAETAAKIQRNIDAAERKTRELKASEETAAELKGRLYFDGEDLKTIVLDFPRTVCTSSSCVDYVQALDGVQKTVYKQQCHEHCYLSGVQTESINNAKIQGCWAMGSGPSYDCRICQHSWKVHMHMTYDLERVTKRVIDQSVNNRLNDTLNDSEKLQIFIQDVQTYAEDLKKEQQEITNICAQFGCYLKKNAITPFNDDIDAHLQMLIKQEKNKPDINQKVIDHLSRMREKYEHNKKIITEAMENPGIKNVSYITDPQKVEDLKQQLFKLKHNGQSLKDIFEGIKKARSEYRYTEAQMEPIKVRRNLGQNQAKRRGLLNSLMNTFGSVGRKLRLSGTLNANKHNKNYRDSEWQYN